MSGELRIIGGKARGRRIRSVPGDTTRPITDRVREALFNIIGVEIQGAVFLDLFAGTGSVGIEALSRGASRATFIDVNRLPIKTIQENLRSTEMAADAVVQQVDAFVFLERLVGVKFDYIYIAPPQYKGIWRRALESVDKKADILSDDAWVIVQIHPVELEELTGEGALKNLVEFDRRQYGSTVLLFYQPLPAS